MLNAWGDLLGTARFIWASMWTTPEPDYDAIGIVCTQELLAAYGEPPVAYVDDIRMTTEQIAAAWGVSLPYSTTFTVGTPFPKPDGSGRTMVPLQFANPGGAYGVPVGGPVTGLCLEFEKSCPVNIPVMDYVSAALRGDLKLVFELSVECVMCGLCAARCPAELSPNNIALFILAALRHS